MKKCLPIVMMILFVCSICKLTNTAFAVNYNLVVDASVKTQPWNRFYEKGVATCHVHTVINTYWGRGITNALKIAHDEAGFKYFRGHGILHDDIGLVDTNKDGSLKLNWTKFDSVYNLALRAGLRPIVEIGTTPKVLASGDETVGESGKVWYNGLSPNKTPPNRGGWGRWMALMDSIVRHCKEKWGEEEVRNNWYFEVWNEPTWWYVGFDKYIELYDYTATALKKADSLIKVGGPAAEGTNTITGGREFQILLDHCYSGTNAATGKKGTPIDFLTYHWYANNSVPIGITGAVLNANNLAKMHKAVLDTIRQKYPWFKGPIFIDEVGPTSSTPVCRDLSSTATWIVKTVHLLNENGPDYPPPQMLAYWALSDLYEEFQNKLNVLSFQEGNYGLLLRGSASYPNSWDIPKPPFQAYRMLHKLGDFELKSSGGTTDNGVNLIATIDSSGDSIQVLVYNHFASTTQSSAPKDDITLTINNIPWASSSDEVKIEHFVLDTFHSNSHTKWVSLGKPAAPTNAQWDAIREASKLEYYDSVAIVKLNNSSYSKKFSAHYFSLHLIILTNPKKVFSENFSIEQKKLNPEKIKIEIKGKNILIFIAESDNYNFSLFSLNGRKILEREILKKGKNNLSFSSPHNGIVLVKCEGKNWSVVRKIMIKQ
ncbi:MAG: T9SS type A sorting domain-containing protein [Chitinispirillaceae bacterium]|nr:T9SS type A sorting domain-containing protein [Chitinispirillaceae bacterium]